MKKEVKKEKSKAIHLLIALMSLLLVFSLVQAYQINTISDKIAVGELGVSAQAVAPTQARAAAPRTAPQAAPTMVGGC